ncbi:DUF4240 domain-containing protein [Muricauda sp. SCSIO 64092]|uniref:DUF4240 domain-containing protein n=1 Tax=Allomuricauda sp. SCSIO 64092 TaxID=2908842 RepID=UPI001FF56410|nr:DUF4240 domain-containing protein [Muricauda sp. SCSIO 64092]UOY05019.1 DUF4240 domain-containing protein [Muricauda sp. SCSIO 64092]
MEEENSKKIADYAEMEESTFWKLIDESRAQTSEVNDRFERLRDLLRELSPKQIVGFRLTMDRLHDELGESSWYVYCDGLAEDERPSLYAIQGRIISMGEESYYNVKDKPN